MANPLPRPPSMHPVTDDDNIINDPWQRWFNEIYNLIGASLVAAPSNALYILQTASQLLQGAQVLATLQSGFVKVTHTTGVLTSQAGILETDLPASGVTPGTYGDGTHVSTITVNAEGFVTGVTLTTITGAAPIGNAGGGLTGFYPNPSLNPGQVIAYDTYSYTYSGGL